jgi:hypothetical protein
MAIEQCYQARTETADAAIDTVLLARYTGATAAGKAAIAAQDRAWLAARQPVCEAAYHSGGTIDEISAAICLLDESTARLAALRGMTPPRARRFVVDPKQFFFQDRSFTDAGVVEPPDPDGHRVAVGAQYQFSVDYSTLARDPHRPGGAGAFVYAPGYPAAAWS